MLLFPLFAFVWSKKKLKLICLASIALFYICGKCGNRIVADEVITLVQIKLIITKRNLIKSSLTLIKKNMHQQFILGYFVSHLIIYTWLQNYWLLSYHHDNENFNIIVWSTNEMTKLYTYTQNKGNVTTWDTFGSLYLYTDHWRMRFCSTNIKIPNNLCWN